MLFSSIAYQAVALLAIIFPFTIAHPLNLLHSHHIHHSHHHLHLRLPNFGSNAAKAAPGMQHPLANNNAATTFDISNVFVNMTVTSAENSHPLSFLIPLRPSEQASSVDPTASTFHHPQTSRISNIQYGTSAKQSSKQFERPEDVVCYAHAASTNNKSNPWKSQQEGAKGFRQKDGVIDLKEVGGHLRGIVSSFSCFLES
ncbi:MAG: hypothetical protein Q9209_000608 [Squamulea sp. 1 TL-2023]